MPPGKHRRPEREAATVRQQATDQAMVMLVIPLLITGNPWAQRTE